MVSFKDRSTNVTCKTSMGLGIGLIPEGRVLDRHYQELRLHRGRAEGRSHGLQAIGALD